MEMVDLRDGMDLWMNGTRSIGDERGLVSLFGV
jgi:hypothetical protein